MFSDNFYPELSGISDSIIDLVQGLTRLGHQIDLYVPKYSREDFRSGGVPVAELDLGLGVHLCRLSSLGYPSPTNQGRIVFPTLLPALLILKRNVQIIHSHHFFGVGMEGLMASKVLGSPLIGTSHTPIAEFVRYAPLRSKVVENIGRRYVTWYYNHCDFVTAPSQSIIDEMRSTGFRRPFQVLSNPIDTDRYCPASSAQEKAGLRAALGISGFVVLYTGRLAVEKHVDTIIRALALAREKIPEILFVVTGHGRDEESLKMLARQLHVEDRIKFLGTVGADDLPGIYKLADVFAIASTAESQSLSLMKAMATAIPVIAVKARALTEYIDERNGFLVAPDDHRAIAERICYCYRNSREGSERGERARASAKKCSAAQIVEKWAEIYKNVYCNFQSLRDRDRVRSLGRAV
jgi:glycosyltransferase involved in cell wall biosynthesis